MMSPYDTAKLSGICRAGVRKEVTFYQENIRFLLSKLLSGLSLEQQWARGTQGEAPVVTTHHAAHAASGGAGGITQNGGGADCG